MVRINQLTKHFSGAAALSEVSLHILKGQRHVLLGSSGSGKSTLVRILMGIIPPDGGEIEIGNQTLRKNNIIPPQWVKNFGYVPQDGGLFPHLNAYENIILAAKTFGWSKEALQVRTEELKNLVSLETSLLKKFPRELSGGQKQRVALMRGLFLNPPILILDEPFGALDPVLRSELQREMREVFRKLEKTVILVTHDLGEAAYLGDTISLLREGKLIQTGVLRDFLESPKEEFVTQFFGAARTLNLRGEK